MRPVPDVGDQAVLDRIDIAVRDMTGSLTWGAGIGVIRGVADPLLLQRHAVVGYFRLSKMSIVKAGLLLGRSAVHAPSKKMPPIIIPSAAPLSAYPPAIA